MRRTGRELRRAPHRFSYESGQRIDGRPVARLAVATIETDPRAHMLSARVPRLRLAPPLPFVAIRRRRQACVRTAEHSVRSDGGRRAKARPARTAAACWPRSDGHERDDRTLTQGPGHRTLPPRTLMLRGSSPRPPTRARWRLSRRSPRTRRAGFSHALLGIEVGADAGCRIPGRWDLVQGGVELGGS